MKNKLISILAAGLCALPMMAQAAPVLSFVEGSGPTVGGSYTQTIGWQFNVNEAVLVTGLGWYDQGANGLGMARTIGIWNGAGTLLASATVPAGTEGVMDGQFRTIGIAPLLLGVGQGYIVGGTDFLGSTDPVYFNVNFTLDPRFGFVDAMFSALGAGLIRPTNHSAAVNGFFGPSFSIGTQPQPEPKPEPKPGVAVPEPGTLALLGLGLAGLGFGARRRKQV